MNNIVDIPFGGMGIPNQLFDDIRTRRQFSDVDTYVRDGVYNGIKVSDECRDRLIPKDTDLGDVFTPVSDVSVYCLHVYPESPDILKYQEIMQSVYTGDAFIDSIDKHPTDKGFVVMLVVNRARMVFRKDTYNELFPTIGEVHGRSDGDSSKPE